MGARINRSSAPSRVTEPRALLTLPGGEIAGAEVVHELPAEVALPVWQTLRSVLTWAAAPPAQRGELFDAAAMRKWEEELLQGGWDADLRFPVAVIVGELADAVVASPERLARSCLCVTEWALSARAPSTALAFAEAAARCWPEHPRYAYTAGQLLRVHGRLREAERWLRRGVSAAATAEDREAQALALNSLGNTCADRGNYREATRIHRRALRICHKHALREREGEVLHDLFVATWYTGDRSTAEEYARKAFECYRGGHVRLPTLVHDVAFSWVERGHYAHALCILQSLPDFFAAAHERIRVLGSTARAAGGCGETAVFERTEEEMWEIVRTEECTRGVATALVDLAVGATGLQKWETAEQALARALEIAASRTEADVLARAERTLDVVRGRRAADLSRSALDGQRLPQFESLAREFRISLGAGAPATCA
jgi:tetratricopeptide (TPR) repeat protein